MEWWGYIVISASALASVLAWVSRLYWATEHKQARDMLITAKDAQIKVLENELKHREDEIKRISEEFKRYQETFSIERIMEFYNRYKEVLDTCYDQLEGELRETQLKLEEFKESNDVNKIELQIYLEKKVILESCLFLCQLQVDHLKDETLHLFDNEESRKKGNYTLEIEKLQDMIVTQLKRIKERDADTS